MKAERRREQLLRLATQMFSKKGYHETHIEAIIKKAKIGKGTFYRYFKNKEDLFVAVLRSFLDQWEKSVFVPPDHFNSENLFEYFRMLTIRSFEFFKVNDDLCNIYLRISPGLSKVFQPYIDAFDNQMLVYIKSYLEAGIKIGYVKDDINIEMASNVIAGGFLRAEYFYFVLNKKEKNDINALSNDFFEIIMQGVLK